MNHKSLPKVAMDTYKLGLWYFQRTAQFPRSHRHTLGTRIEEQILNIIEATSDACYAKEKMRHLHLANRHLSKLRLLTRFAMDLRILSTSQHEFVSKEIDAIGRQIGGWRKSLTHAETPE